MSTIPSEPSSATAPTGTSTTTTTNTNDTNDDVWKETSKGYSDQITRLTSLYATDLILLLHPYIMKAKTILDIGCGTGAFVQAYIQHYPNGIVGQTIISSDLSPGMIEQAQIAINSILEKNKNEEFHTKLIYQTEDGTQLHGINDSSIDIVISLYGVFLIPNQNDTLQSIHRVLNPNHGIFANVAWTIPSFMSSSTVQSSSSSEATPPSSPIDPSFGGNFQVAFMRMVATAKEIMNSSSSSSSSDENVDNTEPSSPPPFLIWVEPKSIEQHLLPYNFYNIKTYRTIHSMVWSNIDILFNLCLINPMMNIPNHNILTIEQKKILKHTLIECCMIDPNDEIINNNNDNNNNDDDTTNIHQPFTLWTASNLTITYIGKKD